MDIKPIHILALAVVGGAVAYYFYSTPTSTVAIGGSGGPSPDNSGAQERTAWAQLGTGIAGIANTILQHSYSTPSQSTTSQPAVTRPNANVPTTINATPTTVTPSRTTKPPVK